MTSESTPTSPGSTPKQSILEKSLKQMTTLGVKVAYTELDMRLNTPVTAKKLKVQTEAYARIVRSCMTNEKCEGITLWVCSALLSC